MPNLPPCALPRLEAEWTKAAARGAVGGGAVGWEYDAGWDGEGWDDGEYDGC